MTAATTGAELHHEIGTGGTFLLRQLAGDVRVRGVDGSVASVREIGGRALADTFRIETSDGRLALIAPDRFGLDIVFGFGRRTAPELEIEVPRGAEVTIETASADVLSDGLAGTQRIRTASGDVRVLAAAGRLDLEAVSGEAHVAAVAALDLKARTISGDIDIQAPVLGRAIVETTSGDVRLDAALGGPGPFSIETISGDATIVGRSGVTIEARTVTGELRSEVPHRREAAPGRKSLVVGDGGTRFAFRSVSGDLRVVAPREPLVGDATPAAPRPAAPSDAPRQADTVGPAGAAWGASDHEVARLDVLRAIERGELSVDAGMRRLAEIEEA